MTVHETCTILLDAQGVTKTFDRVTVLKDVDLEIRSGEIHALVGSNGSGKSTLIKILSGYHQPTSGRIRRGNDPSTGKSCNIGFVHQDLGLVESMSVAENVAFACGYSRGSLGRIRWRASRLQVAELLAGFGLNARPDQAISSLSATERRLVAIARATSYLGSTAGVLVLDEPTAGLPAEEVHRVLEAMRLIADRGAGVLFVSHNLPETLSVADRVTVLRDGLLVARVPSADATVEQLAAHMFGTADNIITDADHVHELFALSRPTTPSRTGAPALLLEHISSVQLRDINLGVWPGEILGVTGLVGCGKSELGRVIAGSQAVTAGSISVSGKPPLRSLGPHETVRAGIGYVPPDRRRSGGVLSMDARENVTLSTVGDFFRGFWLRKRLELGTVSTEMATVGAVPCEPERSFASFSGGNQQKIVFARVLRMVPSVVVFDDPTQGVDAGTVPDLYRLIREMAARGCAVIVITSDLDELVAVSERVIVLESGRQVDELSNSDVTLEKVSFALARSHQVDEGKVRYESRRP